MHRIINVIGDANLYSYLTGDEKGTLEVVGSKDSVTISSPESGRYIKITAGNTWKVNTHEKKEDIPLPSVSYYLINTFYMEKIKAKKIEKIIS